MMSIRKERKAYALAVVVTLLFAAIYELFSHQVYSDYMIFAFSFPLLGGLLPYTALSAVKKHRLPGAVSRCLYDSGVATLTAGSLFRGVLEIYGTTSRLSGVYWIAGGALLLSGLLLYAAESGKSTGKNPFS